jgi:hypothetical protein
VSIKVTAVVELIWTSGEYIRSKWGYYAPNFLYNIIPPMFLPKFQYIGFRYGLCSTDIGIFIDIWSTAIS